VDGKGASRRLMYGRRTWSGWSPCLRRGARRGDQIASPIAPGYRAACRHEREGDRQSEPARRSAPVLRHTPIANRNRAAPELEPSTGRRRRSAWNSSCGQSRLRGEDSTAFSKREDPGCSASSVTIRPTESAAPFLRARSGHEEDRDPARAGGGVPARWSGGPAVDRAGFEAHDRAHERHLAGPAWTLRALKGLSAGGRVPTATCSAGRRWAGKPFSLKARAREEFSAFFDAAETLSLGLQRLPDDELWLADPRRATPGRVSSNNRSKQFERVLVLWRVAASPDFFFDGIGGQRWRSRPRTGEDARVSIRRMRGGDRRAAASSTPGTRTEDHPLNPTGRRGRTG